MRNADQGQTELPIFQLLSACTHENTQRRLSRFFQQDDGRKDRDSLNAVETSGRQIERRQKPTKHGVGVLVGKVAAEMGDYVGALA